ITSTHKLSEDEIKKKMDDAKQYEEEDKRIKELIEIKNQADTLAYTTEKALSDLGDKVSEEERTSITEKIVKTREAIASDNKDTIQAAIDELTKEMQKISTKIYEQAAQEQAAAGAQPENEGEAGDDNVVDAEYEVVDEDKD
ncbi:MAG: Hsp70 family protein, partial [ANME-2 cluster archaeon]|nr:Hsp70 family protein [ANME-2 cluster archaeon]